MAWLGLALFAGWCIGRPYGSGATSLAAVAAVMAANLLFSRQPGNANNDVVAIALFLSSVALLLNVRWPELGACAERLGLRRAPCWSRVSPPGSRSARSSRSFRPVLALTVGVIWISGTGSPAARVGRVDRRRWSSAAATGTCAT